MSISIRRSLRARCDADRQFVPVRSGAEFRKRAAMADVRFAGSDMDRRRRLMASDFESTTDEESVDSASSGLSGSSGAAFVQLSRDRLIRRVISPRLWKNWLVAGVLIGTPLLLGMARVLGLLSRRSSTEADQVSSALCGLSGLELFLAAQLCLLICWVRAASAVDFHGGFRTWRWMSILLVGISGLLLTGASEPLMDGMARLLKPLLGEIESARPALLLVPAVACLAFVLRYLIPDMGRCRQAQLLAIVAVAGAVVRVLLGFRGPLVELPGALSILTAFVSGLALSSALFHCRYVIHVNPNPPVETNRETRKRQLPSSSDATEPKAAKKPSKNDIAEELPPRIAPTVAGIEAANPQPEIEPSSVPTVSVAEPRQLELAEGSQEKLVAGRADKKAKQSKKQLKKAG